MGDKYFKSKDCLDLTKVIDHHEYEDGIKLTFQDYQSDITVTIEVQDGQGHRVCLAEEELENIIDVFKKYKAARKTIIEDSKE